MNIRDDLLTRQLLTFTKRPYTSWQLLMQQEKEVKIELKYTLMIHDDSLESLEHADQGLLEKYSPTEQQKDYSRSQRFTNNHGCEASYSNPIPGSFKKSLS